MGGGGQEAVMMGQCAVLWKSGKLRPSMQHAAAAVVYLFFFA